MGLHWRGAAVVVQDETFWSDRRAELNIHVAVSIRAEKGGAITTVQQQHKARRCLPGPSQAAQFNISSAKFTHMS